MDSDSLKSWGFVTWYPFEDETEKELLKILPNSPGVYVIRWNQGFTRIKGETDILYIGKSDQGIQSRIYQYYHYGETQYTNQRISHCRRILGGLEISYKLCSAAEVRAVEMELLLEFELEHMEFPPLNRGL